MQVRGLHFGCCRLVVANDVAVLSEAGLHEHCKLHVWRQKLGKGLGAGGCSLVQGRGLNDRM